MHRLTSVLFSLVLLGSLLLGCSSGDSGSTLRPVRCSIPGAKFCVTSCNLGCSAVGCVITDIAQNQTIALEFSDFIDPGSLNAASVSLQTASGQTPIGGPWQPDPPGAQLFNRIVFRPGVQQTGGVTTFGFRANETYLLTLPGGPGEQQALRSVSGEPLAATLSCTLNVTRGIIDLDGKPPEVCTVTPAPGSTGVPNNAQIVLEFSEDLDVSPFVGSTTATSPVVYRLRRTRRNAQGQLECDPNQPARDVGGSPQAIRVERADPCTPPPQPGAPPPATVSFTQVVLKPAIQLPGEVCVEIEVTNRVRDLSGKPAVPRVFSFITDATVSAELDVAENFASDAQRDPNYSSGTWGGGRAVPGLIGGDGALGDFVVSDGREVQGPPNPIYEWSTDSQVIPGTRTRSGQDITVQDGIFHFARFELPAGTTLRWVGSKPAQVFVRGAVDVRGKIELNAPGLAVYNNASLTGQEGGLGAAGGGRGGNGADMPDGTGNPPRFSGQNGEDVQLPAGHAYAAAAVGTGGKGSSLYPESGLNADVTYLALGLSFSAQMAAGGGGGGFGTAGTDGRVVRTTENTGEHGPNGVKGKALNLLPVPSGVASIDHFLAGGSGGGGGGGSPFFSLKPSVSWRSGAGGLGGGGGLLLRAGGHFTAAAGSIIEARGGSGPRTTATILTPAAPGGGGSGGSVVIQCGGKASQLGTIDVRGGEGTFYAENLAYFVEVEGGDGGGGMIRLEVPEANPGVSLLGNTMPAATAANVGTLTDRDLVVGDQSRFYATRQVFPPTFLRYELVVLENGTPVLYSDDPTWKPAQNRGPATGPGVPVQVFFQGAEVSSTGTVNSASMGPWRTQVAPLPGPGNDLADDNATGFRFQLIYDRSIVQQLEVRQVRVYFRT